MSTSQSNKNSFYRQSSEIELKTIVNDNTVGLLDAEKAIKSDQANVKYERSNGINIKFQDIIYRARWNTIWDRCKCNKHCQFNFNRIFIVQSVISIEFSSLIYGIICITIFIALGGSKNILNHENFLSVIVKNVNKKRLLQTIRKT